MGEFRVGDKVEAFLTYFGWYKGEIDRIDCGEFVSDSGKTYYENIYAIHFFECPYVAVFSYGWLTASRLRHYSDW